MNYLANFVYTIVALSFVVVVNKTNRFCVLLRFRIEQMDRMLGNQYTKYKLNAYHTYASFADK